MAAASDLNSDEVPLMGSAAAAAAMAAAVAAGVEWREKRNSRARQLAKEDKLQKVREG